MPELVFEVIQEADGGYCAECLTENIFTQANTWDKLRANVVEATAAFFCDRPPPHQRLAVPAHDPLRLGTLSSILRSVAEHKGAPRDAIIATL
jgi:hypothetical protein